MGTKKGDPVYDLTGQRFEKVVVLEYVHSGKWKCLCDCGNTFITAGQGLRNKRTKSCGCWYKNGDYRTGRIIKHGKTHTRLFRTWRAMITRCSNSNDKSYANYGGRGIVVCDEWKNDFIRFYEWAIKHGYSDNLTIDREDNNKGYSPDNCRWVTYKTQLNNTRRNHYILYNGKKQTLTQWGEELGISPKTLFHRIERGWTIERALTTPVQEHHRRGA